MYLEFYKPTFPNMADLEVEKDRKLLQFEFLSRPILEIPNGCEAAASEECKSQGGEGEEGKCQPVEASKENGILIEDEENDGYQTPTSSEHKIPAIRRCPPAPRKPRSMPLKKRKADFDSCHIRIDISEDIESFFRPIIVDSGLKIKKARKGDTK
ncbi:uncharacterized protein LOC131244634 [Magnolia sinica]|uniref:uncharacterized protein LOC131244634 n=1 Tax=Magnolia sinica TaxID=86752 RepID=UPI0026582413|nr:uncharacterized protein LOC131244634 [Magnolia sinica]